MKLEEYLKNKLDITLEEANKIVEVFHSYKKEYGHHKYEQDQDIHSKIRESQDFCQENGYELEKLHCNCCHNNCLLSSPNCGRGKMVQEEILNRNK